MGSALPTPTMSSARLGVLSCVLLAVLADDKAPENDHVTRIDKLMEEAGSVADFDHVLTIKLPASYDYFCFHETASNASRTHPTPLRGLFFIYSVGNVANTDVKFVVLGPQDEKVEGSDDFSAHRGSPVIAEDAKVYEDDFLFTRNAQDGAFDLRATKKGDYRFCFLNPNTEKLVTFALNAQLDKINAFLSNEHLDPLSESLKNVWRRLMHLQREQVYGHKVAQQHRDLVEATLDYITWLTVAEAIVLVVCSIAQICFVQKLEFKSALGKV